MRKREKENFTNLQINLHLIPTVPVNPAESCWERTVFNRRKRREREEREMENEREERERVRVRESESERE